MVIAGLAPAALAIPPNASAPAVAAPAAIASRLDQTPICLSATLSNPLSHQPPNGEMNISARAPSVDDPPDAFAKADSNRAFGFAPALENQLVAILEEAASLAAGKLDRPLAALADKHGLFLCKP